MANAGVGVLFVNADYYPVSMGGGDSSPECIQRIYKTVELLFYVLVTSVVLFYAGDLGR